MILVQRQGRQISSALWLGIGLGGAIGLTALFLLPWLPRFQPLPFVDSGVFLYIGWRWRHGQIPYRDLWDHKPPFVYLVDALGYSLTGGQAGVWGLEVLLIGLAFLLLALSLRRWADGWAVAALIPAFWSAFLASYERNMTENYALLWQAGVLWLLTLSGRRKGHFNWLEAISTLIRWCRPAGIPPL